MLSNSALSFFKKLPSLLITHKRPNLLRTKHSRQSLGFERLEDRNLLASATFNDGAIFILGDPTDDKITITAVDDLHIQVKVNDVIDEVFSAASVSRIVVWGGAGNDRIENSTHKFSDQYGQEGNDELIGGFVSDSLSGGLGDDTISGRALDDLLLGGAGNDMLLGGNGDDSLTGGEGDDLLLGADGNDSLAGNDGEDRLWGQVGDDQLIGNGGLNFLHGGRGDDTIHGGHGDDSIWGGEGQDSIFGGLGDDWITGGEGNDLLSGGDGKDFLRGDAGNDEISGGSGNDRVEGSEGNDTLQGGSENDFLVGGQGDDAIGGNDGHDQLSGGTGNDTLLGGNGQDDLQGGSGDDWLDGGDQNDRLFGDQGTDWLEGGLGNDGLFGGIGEETDQLNGGHGSDRFLIWGDNDKINDASSLEGIVRFANTAPNYNFEYREQLSNWTSADIRAIDDSLQEIHRRVGSSLLLRNTTGNQPTTFVKNDGGTRGYFGVNYNRGYRLISMNLTNNSVYNGRFDPSNDRHRAHVIRVVQHELGHSWDSSSEIRRYLRGSKIWNEFISLEERGIKWQPNLIPIENFADAIDYAIDNQTVNDHRQPILNLLNRFFAELRDLGS